MAHFTDEQENKILKALGKRSESESYLDWETGYDLSDVADSLKKLIQRCGDNPERDGLQETPFRVVKAFLEYTEGYAEDPKKHLFKTFDVEHDELVLVKDIPFNSMCEHHFAPIIGKAHIAYIPDGKITGLSKLARVLDGYSRRFQVQERLTNEVANAIQEVLQPKAVAVIIEAEHYCMSGRGVRKHGASTVTSAMRGAFREEPSARAEVLSLLKS